MKTRFIDDHGVERPIIGVKMSAHQHPSGLKMTDSQARARHRLNAEVHGQRVQAARTAGASATAKALSDALSDTAYRIMAERPGLDFGRAMREAIRQRPHTAKAYSESVKHQAESRANAGGMPTKFSGYACASCGADLSHHGLSDDRKQCACTECGQQHALDDTEAEALSSGSLRVGTRSPEQPLDEGAGDADALEDLVGAPPLQAHEIACRESNGAPTVLRGLQRQIRNEQRRRRAGDKPVL